MANLHVIRTQKLDTQGTGPLGKKLGDHCRSCLPLLPGVLFICLVSSSTGPPWGLVHTCRLPLWKPRGKMPHLPNSSASIHFPSLEQAEV